MLQSIILIIIGFIMLVVGADMLVKGSSNIAKKFKIPETIIGLTIVAIGTSMPELVITISSAGKNASDLIIGNVIGSNICNLLFILGTTAILRPIVLDKDVKIVHLPVAFISTFAIYAMGMGLFGSENGIISKIDGFLLIGLYFIYFLYPIIIELVDIFKSEKEEKAIIMEKQKFSVIGSIIYIIIGAVLLKFGGDLVVDESSEIATLFGISERVIGLTIVAIGTALPEFVTSIIAVVKDEGGLAVGNLVGSCILNAFLILGAGAAITPLVFSTEFIENLILLGGCMIFIWISSFFGKKNVITRYKAGVLLVAFVIYMVRLFE